MNLTTVITNSGRSSLLMQAFQSVRSAGIDSIVVVSAPITEKVNQTHMMIRNEHPTTKIVAIHPDPGCNATWLAGVKAATTEWVHILHDDDLMLPLFKEKVEAALKLGVDFVFFDASSHSPDGSLKPQHHHLWNRAGSVWPALTLRALVLKNTHAISPVSGVFRKEHLLRVLEEFQKNCAPRKEFQMREKMEVGNDMLIWLRATEGKGNFAYIDVPLVSYGNHPGSTTVSDQQSKTPVLPAIYKATKKYWSESLRPSAPTLSAPKTSERTIPVIYERLTPCPRFSISIVCFNNLALTQACIESVLKYSTDFELIVTDNASTDGTDKYLIDLEAKLGAQLRIITNKSNLGFKDPNNYALTIARGEYLVLLNNDMEACAGWLDKLQKPLNDNHKIAVTGISHTCTAIDVNFVGHHDPNRLEYIEGSCLMIPTAIARKHGLFSDYLSFAYWEDTDLSFRLQELGYTIQTVALPMQHQHRGATTRTVDIRPHIEKNTVEMKRRWNFFFKRREFKRRILVRRLGARGDVLLVTPVLKALREKYPQAEIEIITKCPEMLTGLTTARLATHGTKWFDHFYDLDLAYEKRPEVHIVQAFADVCEVKLSPNWSMEMVATDADRAWGQKKSRGLKVALIHGGMSTWPGKNWPVERMTEVVRALRKQGFFTVAVGAEDSPACGCDESIAGKATPQQLYALAKHSDLFVGIDSMPQHVACAANVPSVVLFGTTNPRRIIRGYGRIIAVQADVTEVSCVGAHGRRTKAVTQAPPCEGECMKAITIEMVLSAARQVKDIEP